MDIKVSVILPSLNMGDYIEECLQSVISQTLEEIEIICVDAGSTDSTLDIIGEYADKDKRIVVIHSDKKSYGYQMNLGIEAAKGEYIGIVETDDYVEPIMYEILYKNAKRYSIDMVKGLPYWIYGEGNDTVREEPICQVPVNRLGVPISPDDYPEVHGWDCSIWNGIYKKNFLQRRNIKFEETKGAAFQDIGFMHHVLNEAACVLYVGNHLYHYRRFREGASTWNPRCIEYTFYEYKSIIDADWLKETHKRDFYKKMILSYLFELEKGYAYSGFDGTYYKGNESANYLKRTIMKSLEECPDMYDDLDWYTKSRMMLFCVSLKQFFDKAGERIIRLRNWEHRLRESIGDRKFVVFGAGRFGRMVAKFQYVNGPVVDAFCDNGLDSEMTSFYGARIFNPADAVAYYPDAYYLIANKKHGFEMNKQLHELGVCNDNIGEFDGTDAMLLDGMQRNIVIV